MHCPNKAIRKYWLPLLATGLLLTPFAAQAETPAGGDATQQAINAVAHHIMLQWRVPCDAPGAQDTHPDIRFAIGKGGYIVSGPDWINQNDLPAWISAAELAKSTVIHAQPYDEIPASLYNQPIEITFDARSACGSKK